MIFPASFEATCACQNELNDQHPLLTDGNQARGGMSLTVQRLLYPLHLAVLVSLHAVLATSRATRLAFRLGHLVFRPWFPRRRSAPASLSDDLANQRWSKLPRHLAVSLVSGGGGGGEQRQRHVGILKSLLQWSRQLGVTTLSVYDETGGPSCPSLNRPGQP